MIQIMTQIGLHYSVNMIPAEFVRASHWATPLRTLDSTGYSVRVAPVDADIVDETAE